mmetsp:Transcript_152351/g.270315  ORF Transcript_152351/g.270315 Transcript_152351/m.270315 type:complete len:187 (-) Transcript_152351:54-614(-)
MAAAAPSANQRSAASTPPAPSDEYRQWLSKLIASNQVAALFQESRKQVQDLPAPAQKRLREFAGDATTEGVLNLKRFKAITVAGRKAKFTDFDFELDSIISEAAAEGSFELTFELTLTCCDDNAWDPQQKTTLEVREPMIRELVTFQKWMMTKENNEVILKTYLQSKGFRIDGFNTDGAPWTLSWA